MNWLARLLRRSRRTATHRSPVRPARNWRPALEHLEDRLQPAFAGLGTAAGFAVLGLQNASVQSSSAVIAGSAGVSQGGQLWNMAGSTITGDVREAAVGQYSGFGGTLRGAVISDAPGMAAADADALKASSDAAALRPTQTFATIASPTTVRGNGGLNVIAVSGSVMSSVTLSGTAQDVFVVNVSGMLFLGSRQALGLAGGVTAAHVLYNFTGGFGSVQAGGTVAGTLLAPGYSVSLTGTLTGEVVGSNSIGLSAGARVNFAGFVYAPAAGASLAGHVSDDGGAPMSGVTVSLYDVAGNLVASATTDDSGAYRFTNLAAGTYTLREAVPAGYYNSSSSAGTVNGAADGVADGESIGSIVLGAGDSGVGYDFTNGFMGF